MPIYEFYCSDCVTVFNFYSPTVNTSKVPTCPKCKKRELDRLMSTFAVLSGKAEVSDDLDLPFDESKMEKALHMLESEMPNINEDDPRQASMLIRKMTEAAGGRLDEGMEEALCRMEAGEDPDKIEEEMGDQLDPESLFQVRKENKEPHC